MELGAVITAAGMSSRMGEFKPLKKLTDKSVIEQMINQFKAAGVKQIVIVTGHFADALKEHLKSYDDLEFVFNPAYQNSDMFTSAKLGLEKIQHQCEKFFFTPVDAPAFSTYTLKQLIEADRAIAKPVCNGRGGHPILIEAKAIPFILNYKGERGMQGALNAYGEEISLMQVSDEGILFNTNTPEEFEEMKRYYNQKLHMTH